VNIPALTFKIYSGGKRIMGANSGTVTPNTSSNSLQQQIDSGPANSGDYTTESSLNGSTTYANNAAAIAAGLPKGALYLVTTTYLVAMVQ
jgi:hypothetical protein